MNQVAPSEPRITPVPRLPDFQFDAAGVPERWYADDVGLTAFWNTLSVAAGAAESQFITAGRWLAARTDDPEVARQTLAFVQQEAYHATVHARLNRVLAAQGLPTDPVRTLTAQLFLAIDELAQRPAYLAAGLAAELIIGEFGHRILAEDDGMAGADARIRPLWLWHWYEEVEHHAALFDGWEAVFGRDAEAVRLRRWGLAYMGVTLLAILPVGTWRMAETAGPLRWRPATWRPLARALFGPQGLFRALLPNVWAATRPGFHPDQLHDAAPLLERWRPQLVDDAWVRPSKEGVPRSEASVEVPPASWRDGWNLLRFCGRAGRLAWVALRAGREGERAGLG